MRRYWTLSALSGALWGLLAYALGARAIGPTVWGGVLASPLIGLAAAWIYLPFYARSRRLRWFGALLTLFATAALFGLAIGVYEAARPLAGRITHAVIVQSILGVLWGLTISAYWLFLWPLAYANHWLLGEWSGVA